MSPKHVTRNGDEMLPEYDFSNAVRGKYYERYRQGSNVVLLDPDVAEVFPNAAAVNDALRALVAVGDATAARRPTGANLPNKASQPANRGRQRSKKLTRSKAARG
jgi:hypothetical protein